VIKKCEAKLFNRDSRGKTGSKCTLSVFDRVAGHDLCWVHLSCIESGTATLAEVLEGRRGESEARAREQQAWREKWRRRRR
jgi:hypothetical protein